MRTCLGLLAVVSAGLQLSAAVQPVHARHGMVVAREPHATDIGVAVLQAGGNAVDAAVAVGMALAVTHPSAGNIGGGGFMLIRFADGRTTFLDFRERAPGKATHDMYRGPDGKPTQDSVTGYLASGVPGTVRGLEYASQEVRQAAVGGARRSGGRTGGEGISRFLGSGAIAANPAGRNSSRFEDSKRIFLRDGKFYEPGEMLLQPELASTLARIARDGAKDFYEGETARLLAEGMAAHGGIITLDDLKNYTVVRINRSRAAIAAIRSLPRRRRVRGSRHSADARACWKDRVREMAARDRRRHLHFMTEAMRRYFADRSEYLGDPDFVKCRCRS